MAHPRGMRDLELALYPMCPPQPLNFLNRKCKAGLIRDKALSLAQGSHSTCQRGCWATTGPLVHVGTTSDGNGEETGSFAQVASTTLVIPIGLMMLS